MRPSTRPCDVLPGIALALALAVAGASAQAQSLFDSMRDASSAGRPGGYVFVSGQVSDTALIPLARDAQRAGFTIVLNGFWGDLHETGQRVARINAACCGEKGAHWQINPLLFQRYGITAVPSFVLSVGPGTGPADYSRVTGEMSLAAALKTFAQQSKLPDHDAPYDLVRGKNFGNRLLQELVHRQARLYDRAQRVPVQGAMYG